MSTEEITKEIIITMIQKGFFDGTDNRKTQSTIREERTESVCQAYHSVAKMVNNCSQRPLDSF